MKTVGAYEAKTHFGQLLDRVEQGETIQITRNGKLIAELKPVESQGEDWATFAGRVAEFRKKYGVKNLTPEEIREWIDEGRR
ncbi:MAG: type II toxin-antitoxin system prevent-host-death family antitoxin [Nitrospirae bacterium]|nr:type II toxin-antitoxin system prevent-host-death family antitoxin [Fimbriimonadaceae bacterium]